MTTTWIVTTDASQEEITARSAREAIVEFAKGEFPGRKVTGEHNLFTRREIEDGAWVRVDAGVEVGR